MFTENENTELAIQPSKQDHHGAYLIDRSPTYFEPLLNYLRHGQIILDSNVNVSGIYSKIIFISKNIINLFRNEINILIQEF